MLNDPRGTAAQPWEVVQRLNAAWRANQVDALAPFFHERARIVDGAHQPLAVGRAACVESYRAFVASAMVEAYTEGVPTVAHFDGTAVVSYPFEIRYTTGGQTYTEAGSDCLVLERVSGRWVVVWRQVVSRAA